MAITRVDPRGLPEIDVYRQVSIASGSKPAFIAGQVAWPPPARRVRDTRGVARGDSRRAARPLGNLPAAEGIPATAGFGLPSNG